MFLDPDLFRYVRLITITDGFFLALFAGII